MAEIRLVKEVKVKKRKAKKGSARKMSAGAVQVTMTPAEGWLKMALREKARQQKLVRDNGVEKLKKAADRVLGRNSAKLAGLLLEKAMDGKLEGARLLVKLAESKKPPVKQKVTWDGKSFAEILASEPEWVEPADEDRSDCDEEKNPAAGLEEVEAGTVSEPARL